MGSDFKNNSESKFLNLCRCCLKNVGYRVISAEYYDSGHREVYKEMIYSTFNLQICPHDTDSLSANMQICQPCITLLRDASSFRQMVLENEEMCLEFARTLAYEDGTKPPDADLKMEPIETEVPLETIRFDIDSHDPDDSFDDDEILANLKLGLTRTEEDVVQNTVKKRKNSRDNKRTSKRRRIQESHEIDKTLPLQKNWSKIAERRGTGPLLRENSLKLIENSTLCVFQWNKSRYRCFCCKEPFSDMNSLKEHTNNCHSLENIEKKIISQQNRLVKVEISSLYCKICQERIESLTKLKVHLIEQHNLSISEDLLVPFKIEEDLKCQICFEKFTVFRLLNIHVNKHFQNQVCHICGAGFSNLVFLNLHKTRSHRPLKCKVCDIIFSSKIDKKQHEISVHGVKYERKFRFPCPFCPERFFQENFRVIHLVEKHGKARPEFQCNVCSKVFITKSLCNNHIKNVHNKEKNQECNICHSFFYTKSDVARHKVTHTGEKNYGCTVCNNSFATKDSLRRHMKRTHVGGN